MCAVVSGSRQGQSEPTVRTKELVTMLDKNKDKKYLAAIAANWITELKRSTTFLWKPRKVRVDDSGWVWGGGRS